MEAFYALGAAVAALLSYQMPVYAARLAGAEDRLNQFWAAGMNDALPAQILFVAFYTIAGFALWAAPFGLIAWVCHPDAGEDIRSVLASPFSPAQACIGAQL
jgi:hypothetical protein